MFLTWLSLKVHKRITKSVHWTWYTVVVNMSSKKQSCSVPFKLKLVDKNGKHFAAKTFKVDRERVQELYFHFVPRVQLLEREGVIRGNVVYMPLTWHMWLWKKRKIYHHDHKLKQLYSLCVHTHKHTHTKTTVYISITEKACENNKTRTDKLL